MTVRIAIVGLGVGRRHLEFLSQMPNVSIEAVCDVQEGPASAYAKQYGAKPYTSYERMLDEVALDAVTLCTPPSLHAPQTEAAAARGLHVLCEKPMAGSLEDCQRMIDAATKHNVKLMIAMKKRFDPYHEFIRTLFRESGSPPRWATVRYALGRVDKDWFWTEGDGGGPLLENAVHIFDALRSFFGDVHRITAEGGTFFMGERAPVADAAAVTFRFTSGAVAAVGVGYGCEWSMAREEILISSDKYVVELQGRFDRANQLRYVDRSAPQEIHNVSLMGAEDTGGGFRGEFEHFIDCVENDKPPRVNGKIGKKAIEVCLAVKRAVREQKPVILYEMAPA